MPFFVLYSNISKNEFSAKLSSYYKLRNIEEATKVPHYWLGGGGGNGQSKWAIPERNQTGGHIEDTFF